MVHIHIEPTTAASWSTNCTSTPLNLHSDCETSRRDKMRNPKSELRWERSGNGVSIRRVATSDGSRGFQATVTAQNDSPVAERRLKASFVRHLKRRYATHIASRLPRGINPTATVKSRYAR